LIRTTQTFVVQIAVEVNARRWGKQNSNATSFCCVPLSAPTDCNGIRSKGNDILAAAQWTGLACKCRITPESCTRLLLHS